MAGLDYMFDTCGYIQKYIGKKIRELFERSTNEYQDPNWVQAAELFNRVVIPCESYSKDYFIEVAQDILKKAEMHNNRVIYKLIPGTYNQKVINYETGSIIPEGAEIMNYEDLLQEIKEWLATTTKLDYEGF